MDIEHDPYFEQAKFLVDQVLDKAVVLMEENQKDVLENVTAIPGLSREQTSVDPLAGLPPVEIKNIDWLTIEEFGVEEGEKKIEEFIKETWEFDNSWLHCIDYLGMIEMEFDTRYHYRVRWSIPTRRKPIPRATACVYFTYSVSKIKPKSYLVDVCYVFETNRLVHRPGQSRFREKWLKDIIESKAQVMNLIDF